MANISNFEPSSTKNNSVEKDDLGISANFPIDRRQGSNISLSSTISSSNSGNTNNHESVQQTSGTQHEVRPASMVRTTTSASTVAPIYSIFTKNQKRFIVAMASWAGFFSPVSANIYFPALNVLAQDLNVSNSLINLTLTTYMIFQGLAPAFIGSLADSMGRRPAYIVCFVIYIGANIGLALQDNYAALLVLRCLQSTGSSATIAMASAVVSDISTPAERGAYMGFTFAGSLLGPAIGPVLGGILAQFLGWRAIFWFLTIFASVFMTVFLVFFPETSRNAVGDGSIPPKGWNMSLMNYLAVRKARNEPRNSQEPEKLQQQTSTNQQIGKNKIRFPNPLASLVIILDKENAMLLFYNAFLFAAFYDVAAILPSQLAKIFGFNELQIGLCYIPFGVGSMCAALVNGQLLDRNFARWCKKLGVQIKRGRDQDLKDFPIEKVRLQIALPATYAACCIILVFGWILDIEGPLAALLVLLFFGAFSISISFNVTSTLLVDFYPTAAATATAANNLVRCLLGAGATALIIPMVNGMGRGWTFTFLSLFLTAASPMMWGTYFCGMKWREQRRLREERKKQNRERNQVGKVEEGNGSEQIDRASAGGGIPELAALAEEDREVEKCNKDLDRGRHLSLTQSRRSRGDLYRARSHDYAH